MNEADMDIFEQFLEKANGAIELFICNSTELLALSMRSDSDDRMHALCQSSVSVIKQIYDKAKPVPRCLLCDRCLRPTDRGCPGVMVGLVPWSAATCALSAGVCKYCCIDEETLEERIKARVSGMVPGSRFVMVDSEKGKMQ